MQCRVILAAMVIGVATLSAQTTAKKTPEQIQASFAAHKGEFDYLLGDWEFTGTNQQYGKIHGLWSAVRLEKGQILDEYLLWMRRVGADRARDFGRAGVKYAEGFRQHLGHGLPREDHLRASLGERLVKALPW